MDDDGVVKNPFGSQDLAPVIGSLGTGVETNELFTEFEQGSFKETSSDFDLALEGKGFIAIETPDGERYTRNGSFILGKEGFLETKDGFKVLGENGPIRVKENNFQIDKDGNVFVNKSFQDDPFRLVSKRENNWDQEVKLDRVKLVDFKKTRYLAKQGDSLYRSTEESGEAKIQERGARARFHQGFIETSNVNPVLEMVNMIDVNRAYEANQKTIQAEDTMLGKLINDVAKI
jgi:flagellar basal-body rod protein FlgG